MNEQISGQARGSNTAGPWVPRPEHRSKRYQTQIKSHLLLEWIKEAKTTELTGLPDQQEKPNAPRHVRDEWHRVPWLAHEGYRSPECQSSFATDPVPMG